MVEKAQTSFPQVCQRCVGDGGTGRAAEANADSFWSIFQSPWNPFLGTNITDGQIGQLVKSVGYGVGNDTNPLFPW